MKKIFKCLLLYIFIISISFIRPMPIAFGDELVNQTGSKINERQANSTDINNGIYNLKYNPNEVLATNGEKIESFVKKEGIKSGGNFIVVNHEKKNISSKTSDISLIDAVNDRTYPGAIQLANRDLVDNRPDIIIAKRRPLTVSVDLPGMGYENRAVVKNPTYSNVSAAVDTLVSKWNSKYSKTNTLPARTQYSESMVYSESQLLAALKVNSKTVGSSLGIDFNAISKGKKTVMVLAYKQIFYTASVDLPDKPSDLFGKNVTFKELTEKGINNNNPPAIVSNVAYGRTIFVKLESTSKSKNVKAAFKALIKNADVESNAEYKDILKESSFTAVVLGGDAKEHNKIITNNFDEIRNVIKANSEMSAKNPGYPISYTSVLLKDNKIAAINNKTDYIETTSTEYSNGKIVLDHSGGYVARFEVKWDEVSYDKKGNEIITHKEWDGNNWSRTAHFYTEIPLDGNCRNISVKAKECTGLAWEWWRTVIDERNVPLVKERVFSIWGTTLYPAKSIEVKA
ncbi:thiol-activated cytolysin family protein [Eubacterium multiforme]|uniref:Thiol-activated cytolysin n=1 Tax=Eubacterium multiforme TaxID=83339 RepID=A0ABT9UNG6_9FIRM|nr:thiol-activated cytolysin family protein [Eubacterium multiforme]MDQ0148178.1 thiol-activated cytolysin [Eubacterium multiforme]